jgi:NAD-dependent deacetylase
LGQAVRVNESSINEVAAALREAKHVAVLTGAGVSSESGIPTFRDALTGFWADYDPNTLATPEGFAKDPALVTRWYDWRRTLCAQVQPNPAHHALALLEQRLNLSGRCLDLITQNVDRLHQAAGSREVIELHGSIWVWRCADCGIEREERGGPMPEYPPRCADCGGLRRPGVVWFGERLPEQAFNRAERAAATCELFLSVGTSSRVYPAAGLLDLAIARGIPTVEINPEPTANADDVRWQLAGKAGEVLPRLISRAFPDAAQPGSTDLLSISATPGDT